VISSSPRSPACRALAAPLASLALVLAACGGGGDPAADPHTDEVVRAVQAFAAADGEDACGLLTTAALERLYGGLEECLERSAEFEAGEVKVDKVTIGERGTRAVAQARSISGRSQFTVVAERVAPPGCRPPCEIAQWRIAEVKTR
jgi:hypothetical protein